MRPNGKAKKIVLFSLILLAGAMALYALFVVSCSVSAFNQLSEGNYHEALLTFNKIPDLTQDISLGRKFAQAGDLMEQGEYDESRELFEELGNFNGASLLFKEINYRQAKDKLLEEDYTTAIDMLLDLGNYMDSEELLNYAKKNLYEKAVDYYENGQITISAALFEKIEDYEDAGKYRILANPKSLDELLSILDFEDAKEALLKSKYFDDYLSGTWSGSKYSLTAKIESGVLVIEHNFPIESREDYVIKDGYLCIYEGGTAEKFLGFSIDSKDKIYVTIVSTGKKVTLKRQ